MLFTHAAYWILETLVSCYTRLLLLPFMLSLAVCGLLYLTGALFILNTSISGFFALAGRGDEALNALIDPLGAFECLHVLTRAFLLDITDLHLTFAEVKIPFYWRVRGFFLYVFKTGLLGVLLWGYIVLAHNVLFSLLRSLIDGLANKKQVPSVAYFSWSQLGVDVLFLLILVISIVQYSGSGSNGVAFLWLILLFLRLGGGTLR